MTADTSGEAARLAEPADLDAVVSIWSAVVEETEAKRGGSLFLRRESGGHVRERANDVLESPETGFVVIGTYDTVPFGYAVVRIEVLADGGRLARVDDLAVMAEAREAGIGEAIMNLVLDEAASRDCFGVDSRALPGDRETKNFFESFGLKARLLTVHRALD